MGDWFYIWNIINNISNWEKIWIARFSESFLSKIFLIIIKLTKFTLKSLNNSILEIMISKLFLQGNSDLHKLLQIDSANIRVLYSNIPCWKTFFEFCSPEAPAGCETNLDKSINSFKRQPHKMLKQTQTIRRLNYLSVFDHFVGLALKVLN